MLIASFAAGTSAEAHRDAALVALRRGLRWSAEYPLQHAILQYELALTLLAAGDAAAAQTERMAAVEGFKRCGARAPE